MTWESTFASGNWDYAQCDEHIYQGTIPPTQAMSNNFEWQYISPKNSLFIAKFNLYTIEISTDAGQTWQNEYNLRNIYDKKRPEEFSSFCCGSITNIGAQDAFLHEQTGNLIVAMGYHGVLVREADGNWQWVGIGDYDYKDMITYDEYVSQKNRDALPAYLFVVSTLILFINIIVIGQLPPLFTLENIFFNILAILMLAVSFVVANIFLFLTACLAIPMTITLVIVALIVLQKQFTLYRDNWRVYVILLLLSMLSVASFILPYYLWYSDILSSFTATNFIAFGNTVVAIFVTRFIFQRYIQSVVLSE